MSDLVFSLAMATALAVDAIIGWPLRFYSMIGHPITWLGAMIGRIDRHLNQSANTPLFRKAWGVVALLLVVGTCAAIATLLQGVILSHFSEPVALVFIGCLAWPLVASRSLYDHVAAVSDPLIRGDLGAARSAVSMIVGRETRDLDEAGVARAAIESLTENASDGVVAPLFWGALFGLPGIVAYKAINTLDSMIGHLTDRHRDFGWASARLDDLVNLIPARLTGALLALSSSAPLNGLRIMLRDGHKHRSPNAGYPEAATAGALGIRLSGPRIYEDRTSNEPWLYEEAPDPEARDIVRALRLFVTSTLLFGAILVVAAYLS